MDDKMKLLEEFNAQLQTLLSRMPKVIPSLAAEFLKAQSTLKGALVVDKSVAIMQFFSFLIEFSDDEKGYEELIKTQRPLIMGCDMEVI